MLEEFHAPVSTLLSVLPGTFVPGPCQVPARRVVFIQRGARCVGWSQPSSRGDGNRYDGGAFPMGPSTPRPGNVAPSPCPFSILSPSLPDCLLVDLSVIPAGTGILQVSFVSRPQRLLFAPQTGTMLCVRDAAVNKMLPASWNLHPSGRD